MDDKNSKKKKLRIIISLTLVLILIGGVLGMVFCNQKGSRYTEAEHIERVRQRIQKKYIDGNSMIREYDAPEGKINAFVKATDFEVFPIYDEKDIMKYCLVEFQPYGFLFVKIRDEQLKGFSWLGASTSMYMLSSTAGEPAWTPCTIDENGAPIWEKDNYGEKAKYYRSPFAERGKQYDKKYLVSYQADDTVYLIPAIKTDEKFVNLYSNEEFDFNVSKKQAVSGYIHFINKKHFDL